MLDQGATDCMQRFGALAPPARAGRFGRGRRHVAEAELPRRCHDARVRRQRAGARPVGAAAPGRQVGHASELLNSHRCCAGCASAASSTACAAASSCGAARLVGGHDARPARRRRAAFGQPVAAALAAHDQHARALPVAALQPLPQRFRIELRRPRGSTSSRRRHTGRAQRREVPGPVEPPAPRGQARCGGRWAKKCCDRIGADEHRQRDCAPARARPAAAAAASCTGAIPISGKRHRVDACARSRAPSSACAAAG